MAINIQNSEHLKEIITQAGQKKSVLVIFHSTSCNSNKTAVADVEEYFNGHEDIIPVKVDIDKCKDVYSEYNPPELPTFLLIGNGRRKINTFLSADACKLFVPEHLGSNLR